MKINYLQECSFPKTGRTFSLVCLLITVFTQNPVYSQSANQNYIRVREPLVGIGTDSQLNSSSGNKDSVRTAIQYFDGLGRPMQTVQRQASPGGRDIIQPVEYDGFGREVKKYLPYVDQGGSYGSYRSTALSDQGAFYADPAAKNAPKVASTPLGTAFSETVFEPSPLNRVLEQGAPGAPWQVQPGGTGHTAKISYTTNDNVAFNSVNTVGSRRVVLFGVTVAANGARTLTRATNAFYGNNELYVTVSKDENWSAGDGCLGTMEEYKDKEGRVVLKRTYNRKNGLTEMLSTYYVYDDFGLLCFVLPPMVNPDNGLPGADPLTKLCYSYRYDHRQRLVEKTIPGGGTDYLIYNKLDQLVATQDAALRTNALGRWQYYKYDAHGREIIMGWYDYGSIISRDSMQAVVNRKTVLWESRDNKQLGYDNLAWPEGSIDFYYVDYYDGYGFYNLSNLPSNPGYAYQAYGTNVKSDQVQGLKTARLTRPSSNSNNLWTVYYYDAKGRLIQEQANNHLRISDRNTTNYAYDFSGNLIKKEYFHTGPSAQTITIANTYSYDHMGRKLETTQKVGTDAVVTLSSNEYNELGQLTDKKLHKKTGQSKYLQSVDYRYNIRGWLTSINDPGLSSGSALNDDDVLTSGTDKFGMQLSYEGGASPSYNGNISSANWQSVNPQSSAVRLKYDYGYDRLNRLKASESSTYVSGSWTKDRNYSEYIDYDVMGNIERLGRWAPVDGVRRQIDSLVYTYNGSRQHTRIDDISPEMASIKDLGFKDIVKLDNEYRYRVTGHVSQDLNRNISSISYASTGPLSKVTYVDGTFTDYANLRGTDELLYTSTTRPGGITELRDRVKNIRYVRMNGGAWDLDYIITDEGRVRRSGTTYTYEYDIKDHLGNTRVTVVDSAGTGTPRVAQLNSYYGFGMGMPGSGVSYASSPKNNYLYNGKELVDDLGWYEYGARMYDPAIARWNAVDPLAEVSRRWSTYQYSYNNPIRFTDIDGMIPGDFLDEDGRKIGSDGKDDGKLYVVKTTQENFDSGAPSAGISKDNKKATEKFIKNNNGNSSAFEANDIAYKNSVEIEGKSSTRQAMVDVVNQDNGKGGTADANNREYGGVIKTDGTVSQSPAGPVSDPTVNPNAHIDISSFDFQSTFHSHPSGTKKVSSTGSNPFGGTTLGGTTTSGSFLHAPSNVGGDVGNSGSKTNYVFSRGNGTVYIYNNNGVSATIPQKYFVTPKQ